MHDFLADSDTDESFTENRTPKQTNFLRFRLELSLVAISSVESNRSKCVECWKEGVLKCFYLGMAFEM